MEIRNLVTFQKLCILRNFTKAADELGYSQSAVTMQIKQLESELQVKLFDRIGKTVDITNEGKRFLKYVNEILNASNNAIADMKSESIPNGVLRIGILESVCTAFLPQILQSYHTLFPRVSTIIKIGTFDELSLLLNSSSIDILWTFEKNLDSHDWIKAFTYNSIIDIVCSPKHRLSSRQQLSLLDIADETFIFTESSCSYRQDFEEHLLYRGYRPNVFLEIGNTDIIKKFVEANLGIAILPHFTLLEELAAQKLSILKLSDYQLIMQGQLFYHKSKWLSPSLSAFLDLVIKSSYN